MSNEVAILQEISTKLDTINKNIEIINNSFLWFLGASVGFVVIYILYKCDFVL